jgi:hypothetical protein
MQGRELWRSKPVDNRLIVLILVVAASGCVHSSAPIDTGQSSGSGLQVQEFDVSDQSLSPGQPAIITLKLRNHHDQRIPIDDISLYNTGVLETESQGCTPSSSEIEQSREDFIPTVECSWRVSAPEEDIEGFDSKTIPVKLNLAYRSELSNSDQPVKIHFKPLNEIERTNEVQETFSNTEVEMVIQTESPVSFQGRTVDVTVRNSGNGRVDSNYSFSYFPEQIFSNCPESKEPLTGQEAHFVCEIDPQTENSQTRNLVVSTSYKYIKAPTLDVEVVNR